MGVPVEHLVKQRLEEIINALIVSRSFWWALDNGHYRLPLRCPRLIFIHHSVNWFIYLFSTTKTVCILLWAINQDIHGLFDRQRYSTADSNHQKWAPSSDTESTLMSVEMNKLLCNMTGTRREQSLYPASVKTSPEGDPDLIWGVCVPVSKGQV